MSRITAGRILILIIAGKIVAALQLTSRILLVALLSARIHDGIDEVRKLSPETIQILFTTTALGIAIAIVLTAGIASVSTTVIVAGSAIVAAPILTFILILAVLTAFLLILRLVGTAAPPGVIQRHVCCSDRAASSPPSVVRQ